MKLIIIVIQLLFFTACSKEIHNYPSSKDKKEIQSNNIYDDDGSGAPNSEVLSPILGKSEKEDYISKEFSFLNFYLWGNYDFSGKQITTYYKDFKGYDLQGNTVVYTKEQVDQIIKAQNEPTIFDFSRFLIPIQVYFESDFLAGYEKNINGDRIMISGGRKQVYTDRDQDGNSNYLNAYKKISPSSVANEYYRLLSHDFKPFCIYQGNKDFQIKSRVYYDVYSMGYAKIKKDQKVAVAVYDIILVEKTNQNTRDLSFSTMSYEPLEVFSGIDNSLKLKCIRIYKNESEFNFLKNLFSEVFIDNVMSFDSYIHNDHEINSLMDWSNKK